MQITIAAVGRLKAGPERELFDRYIERAGQSGSSDWVVRHQEFHGRIYALSGRPKLIRQIAALHVVIEPYMRIWFDYVDKPLSSREEHAALIAAILTERGLGGDSVDLDARLDNFRRDRASRAQGARQLAQRWASQVLSPSPVGGEGLGRGQAGDAQISTGMILALAFPDRVARNRGKASFTLANGRGASVEQTSALAREPYLAVAELTGTAASGRILLAAPIMQSEIEARFADHITVDDEISFDKAAMALRARRRKRLHALMLSEQPLAVVPSEETARVLADGLAGTSLDRLPWSNGPICPTLR